MPSYPGKGTYDRIGSYNERNDECEMEKSKMRRDMEKLMAENELLKAKLSENQEELEALRRALEAAGIRSFSDPQKIGIEISHLIRRASVNGVDAEMVSFYFSFNSHASSYFLGGPGGIYKL